MYRYEYLISAIIPFKNLLPKCNLPLIYTYNRSTFIYRYTHRNGTLNGLIKTIRQIPLWEYISDSFVKRDKHARNSSKIGAFKGKIWDFFQKNGVDHRRRNLIAWSSLSNLGGNAHCKKLVMVISGSAARFSNYDTSTKRFSNTESFYVINDRKGIGLRKGIQVGWQCGIRSWERSRAFDQP